MHRRHAMASLFASLAVARRATSLDRRPNNADPGLDRMPDYSKASVELVAGTPKADGFSFPAEWETHARSLMVWAPPQNWRDSGIPQRAVRRQWADVANTLVEYEPVTMVVDPQDQTIARKLLSKQVELLIHPVNDGWVRDSGPMILKNAQGQRRVAGFTFNGWGAKFPPYGDDALLKARLAADLDLAMYPIDLVLEGGGVAVDGDGTVITTEQCLLHKTRNRGVSKAEIEKVLNESLGTEKVVWLGKGLVPDPVTDGHVDGIAAFVEPGVVLLHSTDDQNDPNYAICRDAKRRLSKTRDARGRRLEVVDLPLTSASIAHMNFYIANGCVLVPTAGSMREDARPMAILRELFPKRDVVGVDGTVLAEGGGGIHCITMQVPA